MAKLEMIVVEFHGTQLPSGCAQLPLDQVPYGRYCLSRAATRLDNLRAQQLLADLRTSGWNMFGAHKYDYVSSRQKLEHLLVRLRFKREPVGQQTVIPVSLLQQLTGQTYLGFELYCGADFSAFIFRANTWNNSVDRQLRFTPKDGGFTLRVSA